MTQLDEAVARYHKIIEGEAFRDLAWADDLQTQMKAQHLIVAGRPVSAVVRPHFLSRRQYTNMVKSAEALFSALDRMERVALSSPALLSRMELLPAEKMLAQVDPGYEHWAMTALLDTSVSNGSLHFTQCNVESSIGVAYGEALSNLFYDSAPMQEMRKRYAVTKLGGSEHLLEALLQAYREFGGKKQPQIAVLEFRQPFQTIESSESGFLVELFQRAGYPAELVSPEQLEYRNGVLRRGDFTIDIVYRRIKMHEFLVRFDLSHPLVRAYRDRAACVVNSFRSELAQKKAIFDLLTDDSLTAGFPLGEREAIKKTLPWTRRVAATKTTYHEQTVDLPQFIRSNRERFVLKPNDDSGDQPSVVGAETDQNGWDRALKVALKNPYVVQEIVSPGDFVFPLYRYGQIEMKKMHVDVHPHSYAGRVHGCSSWLTPVSSGFSSTVGLAPTFILDVKSSHDGK